MNDYADKLLQLYEFQKKTVEACEESFRKSGLDKYDTSKIFEEWGQKKFDPYKLTYTTHFIKTNDELIDFYKEFVDALVEVQKEVYKRKMAKIDDDEKEKEKKKQDENLEKMKEQMKKDGDEIKKLSDELKKKNDERKNNDNPKPESPSPRKEEPNPDLPKKEDTFDESSKKKYTQEAERELKKNNISDQKLNQELGVDDWRVEMNKSVDWSTAQTFWFSIKDAIEKMSKKIVCETCKETKSPIIEYTALDSKGEKKYFCSWECQNDFKNKNKGINKDDAKEIKKELQEIKTYLKKHNENVNKVLNGLLAWMKEGGVVNIALSNDKIVVELSNKQTKVIEESELSSEQRVMKDFLQNASGKKSVSRSEVEEMVIGSNSERGGKDNKQPSGGNAGIITAIIVAGILFAVVIGAVVYKSRKKDY